MLIFIKCVLHYSAVLLDTGNTFFLKVEFLRKEFDQKSHLSILNVSRFPSSINSSQKNIYVTMT